MLTEAQIRSLQRAQETLTAIQTRLEEHPARGYDQGRIVQAIAHAERALFDLANLVETLTSIQRITEEALPTVRTRKRT